MDALPPQPPAFEQSIKQKLVECGLSGAGVSVTYQDELQSYEIVTFTQIATDGQYDAYVAEQYRPVMLAQAKQELGRRGRLEGFPSRASFESDKLFAEALEQHCGLTKGSAIHPMGSAFAFQPPSDDPLDFSAFSAKYGCLLAAIQLVIAKKELEIGFIGNEAFGASK
jgi:hypothetical protein